MKIKSAAIVFILFTTLSSCGRKTSTDEESTEEVEINFENEIDTTLITADDPFRNQPNAMCTIIRKLDVSQYSPQTVTSEPENFPKKYCLLDICLETINQGAMTINLGEEGESVSSTFVLIKIFNSYEEAKAYADKFKISDAKWEELSQ